MAQWDPNHIARLLVEAGEIAFSYYHRARVEMKADRSLVTEADHAVEALLAGKLENVDAGDYFLGEETVSQRGEAYLQAGFDSDMWVIDPIDGTAPYANGLPNWGISIGLARKAVMTEGAIYLPVTRELFMTDGGTILFGEVDPCSDDIDLKPIELRSNPLGEGGMIAVTQSIAKGGNFPVRNPIQAIGCAVVPFGYVLVGRYRSYISKMKIWDLAGSYPMFRAAGYSIKFLDGRDVPADLREACAWEADAEVRWQLRGTLICSADDTITEELRSLVTLGEE